MLLNEASKGKAFNKKIVKKLLPLHILTMKDLYIEMNIFITNQGLVKNVPDETIASLPNKVMSSEMHATASLAHRIEEDELKKV